MKDQSRPAQQKILRALTTPMSIKDLAQKMGLSHASVRSAMTAMHKRGDVARDTADARNHLWTRAKYLGDELLPEIAPSAVSTNPFHWQGRPSIFATGADARMFSDCALNSVRKPGSPENRQHVHLPGSAPYLRTAGSVGTEWSHVAPKAERDFAR